MLIFSVGIPGSGKTRYGNILKNEHNFEVICPDDYRLKAGSINNRKIENAVWTECFKDCVQLLIKNKNVYFSSTCLSTLSVISEIKEYIKKLKTPVMLFYFKDSRNPGLCVNRIRDDLNNNVVRADVPAEDVFKMYTRYLSCLKRQDEFYKYMYKLSTSVLIVEDDDPYNLFNIAVCKQEVIDAT